MATNATESTSGGSFQCNVCFELPQEPVVTLCGHLFCWPCLSKWLHIHSRSPECPVCKAVVQVHKLVPLYGCGKHSVDLRSKNNVPGRATDITHGPAGQQLAMAPQADPNRRPPTRVKRKRQRPEGGDTSTSNTRSDDPPQLEVGNQQTEGASQSIYVVVNAWDNRPLYPIYKVDYPYLAPAPPPLRLLATLEIKGSRSFVSVQTRRRRWIVAAGGRHSVVFDADTEEVICGPNLINRKDTPVLLAVEDKVYALSSSPRVKGKRDFEPWFEVLDLSQATAVDGRLQGCAWEELPSPPCFPCQLATHQFYSPPWITVQSYVVVGSYILLSIRSNQPATYAFHTVSAKWHKVHGGESLPFLGCPTPLHGGVAGFYLGEPAQDNPRCSGLAWQNHPVMSAYSIRLSSSEKKDGIKLSITEFPIRSSQTCDVVTGLHYSSLDKGIFCSLDWKCRTHVQRSWDDDFLADDVHYSKKATVKLRTYQMEDDSLLQEEGRHC